jgi:hypothetical protein
MAHKRMGSTLDSFLEEEGILEEATDQARKRVLAYQIDAAGTSSPSQQGQTQQGQTQQGQTQQGQRSAGQRNPA